MNISEQAKQAQLEESPSACPADSLGGSLL